MVDMHDAAESQEELPHESGSSGQLVEALGEALRNQLVRTKEYRVDKGDIPILAQGNWNHWKGSVLLALEEAGLDDILDSSEMLHEMDQESKAKLKNSKSSHTAESQQRRESIITTKCYTRYKATVGKVAPKLCNAKCGDRTSSTWKVSHLDQETKRRCDQLLHTCIGNS